MADQERIEQTEEVDADFFENKIAMHIQLFCETYGIEDLVKESQARWNSCLRFVRKNVFPDKSCLKMHDNIYNSNNPIKSNYNMFNYALLSDICDIYIDQCFLYDKEISLMGFSNLTGIDYDIITEWGYKTNRVLSSAGTGIYEKILRFNEESLSDKLATGAKNPVGVIAILNRRHGWASPYTADSNRQRQAITADQLPRIAPPVAGIEQNEAEKQVFPSNCTKEIEVIDVTEKAQKPGSLENTGFPGDGR